ncbi:MAG TPA: hypothetical protein VHH33_09635 [Nitrososphaeraceae archaeon]|jgi:hypothetical protein|nr:hypothetical protein [Nitrososphaeraceae archaeon]
MIQHNNRKAGDIANISLLLFVHFMLLIVLPAQLIHNLSISYAYDPEAGNLLSEGGQICPLESECDKQNENQTDTHNMTQNVPSTGKSDNGQGSIAGPIINNSNGTQNETNLDNITSLDGQIKNSIQKMINITTDKQIYNPGDKVSISIKNTGSEELTFPNSALGLTIRNVASNELYPILSAQVITILGPGDSKSLEWDQMGIDGNQAPSGNYTASVNSGINTANTTFSIR